MGQQVKIFDNVIRVSVEKIIPNTWNPNEQSDFIFQKEMSSIVNNGFLAPILVREIGDMYEIIDGEHRYKAALQLGMTEIPVNNYGKIKDVHAKKLTVIMNETKGKLDKNKFALFLQDLNQDMTFEDMALDMPFSESELLSFSKDTEINWNELDENITGIKEEKAVNVKIDFTEDELAIIDKARGKSSRESFIKSKALQEIDSKKDN